MSSIRSRIPTRLLETLREEIHCSVHHSVARIILRGTMRAPACNPFQNPICSVLRLHPDVPEYSALLCGVPSCHVISVRNYILLQPTSYIHLHRTSEWWPSRKLSLERKAFSWLPGTRIRSVAGLGKVLTKAALSYCLTNLKNLPRYAEAKRSLYLSFFLRN